jgi:hypothetical protein
VTHISTLNHEPVDDAVKLRVEIVEFSVVGATVLSRAQTPEVLGGFGGEVVEELEDDTACTRGADLYVHVHFEVGFGAHFFDGVIIYV